MIQYVPIGTAIRGFCISAQSWRVPAFTSARPDNYIGRSGNEDYFWVLGTWYDAYTAALSAARAARERGAA